MEAGQPKQAELERRKRGRPLGSKNKRTSLFPPIATTSPADTDNTGNTGDTREKLLVGKEATFDEKQLVYSRAEEGMHEVPKEVYQRVLDTVTATIEDDARQWQVTQIVFGEAMRRLDANRRGLAITYAQLMPSHEDGIHSLREVSMRGQYPWSHDSESRVYLGSTTLAGSAAMLQRIQVWDNLSDEERLLVDIDEHERSAVACPVMRGGRIAGVLIVSSTQAGFFTDKVACQSVVEYAQLLSLGLREEHFVAPTLLRLRPMPSLRWQRTELASTYLQRIALYARKHKVGRKEAERQVVPEMECEFEVRGHTLRDEYPQDVYYSPNNTSSFESW